MEEEDALARQHALASSKAADDAEAAAQEAQKIADNKSRAADVVGVANSSEASHDAARAQATYKACEKSAKAARNDADAAQHAIDDHDRRKRLQAHEATLDEARAFAATAKEARVVCERDETSVDDALAKAAEARAAADFCAKLRSLQGRQRHARRSPRGRDDARGDISDREARAWWRAPAHRSASGRIAMRASRAPRLRNAVIGRGCLMKT